MKKIVEEQVNKYTDGGYVTYFRYKVLENNNVNNVRSNWCQATYTTFDFEERDAIFPSLDDAIRFCKGEFGVVKRKNVMAFNDDGEETTLE